MADANYSQNIQTATAARKADIAIRVLADANGTILAGSNGQKWLKA
jgi:hypothetical protein